uniref:IMV membrane protein n=1 Tax=Apapanepox virus TaxID=3049969 RepID=A0AAT9USR9_9POXV
MSSTTMKKFTNLDFSTAFSIITIVLSLVLCLVIGYIQAVMLRELSDSINNNLITQKYYYAYWVYAPHIRSLEYKY